jgi:hypothetical protein
VLIDLCVGLMQCLASVIGSFVSLADGVGDLLKLRDFSTDSAMKRFKECTIPGDLTAPASDPMATFATRVSAGLAGDSDSGRDAEQPAGQPLRGARTGR